MTRYKLMNFQLFAPIIGGSVWHLGYLLLPVLGLCYYLVTTLLELKSDRCSAVAVPVALSLPQRG